MTGGPGEPVTDPLAPGVLDAVIADIDAANAEDPRSLEARGVQGPLELRHSELMTYWVTHLDPAADDAQLVAARAHHFRRWTRPRTDYPAGRQGYLRWRTAAKKAHATEVGELLSRHGVAQEFVDRVGSIIRKENRTTDPGVQTHEDALCLVFLETQLDDLIDDVGAERTVEILARTMGKMSEPAIAVASGLALSSRGSLALRTAASVDGAGSRREP